MFRGFTKAVFLEERLGNISKISFCHIVFISETYLDTVTSSNNGNINPWRHFDYNGLS